MEDLLSSAGTANTDLQHRVVAAVDRYRRGVAEDIIGVVATSVAAEDVLHRPAELAPGPRLHVQAVVVVGAVHLPQHQLQLYSSVL